MQLYQRRYINRYYNNTDRPSNQQDLVKKSLWPINQIGLFNFADQTIRVALSIQLLQKELWFSVSFKAQCGCRPRKSTLHAVRAVFQPPFPMVTCYLSFCLFKILMISNLPVVIIGILIKLIITCSRIYQLILLLDFCYFWSTAISPLYRPLTPFLK